MNKARSREGAVTGNAAAPAGGKGVSKIETLETLSR